MKRLHENTWYLPDPDEEEYLSDQDVMKQDLQEDYSFYLDSEKWDLIRNAVIQRDKVCSVCGSEKRLQVHHVRYISRKEEDISNIDHLTLLCEKCHKTTHNK